MSRCLNAPFFGKKYVGDSETKYPPPTWTKKLRSCRVDSIPKTRIQMFEWLNIPSVSTLRWLSVLHANFQGDSG